MIQQIVVICSQNFGDAKVGAAQLNFRQIDHVYLETLRRSYSNCLVFGCKGVLACSILPDVKGPLDADDT